MSRFILTDDGAVNVDRVATMRRSQDKYGDVELIGSDGHVIGLTSLERFLMVGIQILPAQPGQRAWIVERVDDTWSWTETPLIGWRESHGVVYGFEPLTLYGSWNDFVVRFLVIQSGEHYTADISAGGYYTAKSQADMEGKIDEWSAHVATKLAAQSTK